MLNSEYLIPPWWNESWADPDYYDGEAAQILGGLRGCAAPEDVLGLLRSVFENAFAALASEGRPGEYAAVAARLWKIRTDEPEAFVESRQAPR